MTVLKQEVGNHNRKYIKYFQNQGSLNKSKLSRLNFLAKTKFIKVINKNLKILQA